VKVGAALSRRQPGDDHPPVRRPAASKSPEAEKFVASLRSPDAAPLFAAHKRRSSACRMSASGQGRDRDVGPDQTIENKKNALRVLQLKELSAVRILHGFDPEGRCCRQDVRIESRGHSSR
jgi:hypothetical protein